MLVRFGLLRIVIDHRKWKGTGQDTIPPWSCTPLPASADEGKYSAEYRAMILHVAVTATDSFQAREQKLRGEARRALRHTHAKPILNDIRAYLEREQPQVLPKSLEGQAIAYTMSNWKALTRHTEDGDLEIDNNGAERSLRGIAVGRKNWMSYGSDNGGEPPPS